MADDIDTYVIKSEYAGVPDAKWPYKKAFKALMAKYGGLVQNKAKLRTLITQLLKQKGYTPKASA